MAPATRCDVKEVRVLVTPFVNFPSLALTAALLVTLDLGAVFHLEGDAKAGKGKSTWKTAPRPRDRSVMLPRLAQDLGAFPKGCRGSLWGLLHPGTDLMQTGTWQRWWQAGKRELVGPTRRGNPGD